MRKRSEKEDYEVGYKKPPKSGRFQKGVSGNPSGRPKRPSDFAEKVSRELGSTMVILEKGKQKIITKAEAMAKQAVNKAVHGNIQYMRLAVECNQQVLEKKAEELRLTKRGVRELTDEELAAIIGESDIKKLIGAAYGEKPTQGRASGRKLVDRRKSRV